MVIVGALLTIGLSNLQHVDMSSSRNMLVVGVPFMASMSISYCLELYPEIIATGTMLVPTTVIFSITTDILTITTG